MTRLLILFLALAPLAACSNNDDRDDTARTSNDPGVTAGVNDEIEGRILEVETNRDEELEIGVTNEVVFFRLTEAARAQINKEMDAEVPEEGFGASIGRTVTGMVADALGMTVQVPLEDIEEMRYEDGRLILDGDARGLNFEINENSGREGIEFDADAAERLIRAFESAR